MAEGASSNASGSGLTAALAWAQSTAWEEGELFAAYRFLDFIYQYEHSRIARAQIFIAWARAMADRQLLPETLAYLERQQHIAEAGSLLWFQIKIHLLQALAHHALGDVGQARSALIHALRLAQPEGYVRVFLDEGEPMRLLIVDCGLRIAQSNLGDERRRLSHYIEQLVAAFPPPAQNQDAPSIRNAQRAPESAIRTLLEPLTERELEILRLVNSGLANNEIADKIVVTVGTVKKHINHLFDKLGVASRTQALARARELKLL
jgi:LuxR family maltose regulon positive regulatory protein